MKKIFHQTKRHATRVVKHLHRHRHKYVGGVFAGFAVVKAILLFAGFFGLIHLGHSFAAGELDNANIVTEYGCATGASACNLSNQGISSIAPDAFVYHTNLQDLYLSNNQISALPEGVFDSLTGLETLWININQLTSIDSGTFANNPHLRELNLGANDLSVIDADTIASITGIGILGLGMNPLTTLPENLTTLTILQNNGLYIDNCYLDYTGFSVQLTNFIDAHTSNADWRATQLTPFTSCSSTDLPQTECEALVNLYNSTDGANWYPQGGWLLTSQICNIWAGISCVDGHVTNINLASTNLSGTISDLSGLPYLETLDLNTNQLTSITTGAFDGLIHLGELWLNSNRLNNLPNNVFDPLTGLYFLILSSNQFTTVPDIINLTGLIDYGGLDLDYNYIDYNILDQGLLDFINIKNTPNYGDRRETQFEICGNVTVDSGEVCDNGLNNGTYGNCNLTCDGYAPYCGDGNTDPEETCDDGGSNGTYGFCSASCDGPTTAVCGNSAIEGDETCDDGVNNGTPGMCNVSCDGTEPILGCTDGNANNYNPSATQDDGSCTYTCGDSIINPGESCDEGPNNGTTNGSCNLSCNGYLSCGDTIVEGYETCDDGVNNGTPGMCNVSCDAIEPAQLDPAIEDYYGSGSKYTANRTNNTCDTGTMTVEYISNYDTSGVDTIPELLSANTIYVLLSGSHITSRTINLTTCSAIVGSGNVTLYSSQRLSWLLNSSSRYTIVDAIKIDGLNDGLGSPHGKNNAGINLIMSSNNTINNTQAYNNMYGFYVYSSNTTINNSQAYNNGNGIYGYSLLDTIINNSQFYNNSNNGIHIDQGSKNNTINNSQIYNNNNGIGITTLSDNNTINNSQIYNNSNAGIYLGMANSNTINNSQAYNNAYGIRNYPDAGGNKYYGTLKLFNNNSGNIYDYVTGFTSGSDLDFPGLFSGGALDTDDAMSCSWITNPMNANGLFLIDTMIYPTCNFAGQNSSRSGDSIQYQYGTNILKQTQPVVDTGNGNPSYLSWSDLSFDPNTYIAEINPLLSFCSANSGSLDVSVSECEALVSFYNDTNGPIWSVKTNWLSGTTIDNWHGVTVSGGRVTNITLNVNNLSGTGDLSSLTGLITISLEQNNLSSINVSGLTNLTTLDLGMGNALSSIDLSSLTNLTHLNLSHNQFSDIDFSGIYKITHLDLSNNKLANIDFSNFTDLIQLFLSDNLLTKLQESIIGITTLDRASMITALNNNCRDTGLMSTGLVDFLNTNTLNNRLSSPNPACPVSLSAPTFSTPNQATSGSTILLTGIATSGVGVNIYSGTTIVASGVIMTNTFSIIVPLSIEGLNTFTAKAVDGFGNLSDASSSVKITKDTTPPTLPLFMTPGQTVTGATMWVNLAVDMFAEKIYIYNSGGIVVASGLTYNMSLFATIVPLDIGTNVFTAIVVDSVGNFSSGSSPLTIIRQDLTLAIPTFSTPNQVTSGSTILLTGIATSGVGVNIYSGTTIVASGSIMANTFSIIVPLSIEGLNTFTAKAVDGSGNLSDASSSVKITKDTTPPVVPIFITAGQTVTGFTIQLQLSVDVSSEQIIIYNSGGTAVASGPTYGMPLIGITVPLITGTNIFTAKTVDSIGNLSSGSTSLTIIQGSSTLTAPIFSTPSQTTSGSTIRLNGSAPMGTRVDIYNGPIVVASGNAPAGMFAILVSLNEGPNTFTAKAVNDSGSSSFSTPVMIIKDSIPPTTPTFTTTGQTVTGATIILYGSGDPSAMWIYIYNSSGIIVGNSMPMMGSFSVSVSLITGSNIFTAKAMDLAGNFSSGSNSVTIVRGSSTLAAPTFSTPDQTTSGATIYLAGLATGASYVNIYNNGSPVISGFMMGNVFVQWFTPLNTGTNVFTARAVDGSGNLSDPSNPVTIIRSIDTLTAPTFSTPNQTTSGATILLTGIATTGISVNIYSGTTIVASGDVIVGTFSIIVPLSIEGMNIFTAKAVDAFGNLSNSSSSVKITKDTIPPTTPTISTPNQTVTTETITLTGTALLARTVNFYNGSGILLASTGLLPPISMGNFSLTISLVMGTNIFSVKSIDAAGNISSGSNSVTIVRSTNTLSAPTISTPNQTTSGATILLLTGIATTGISVNIYSGATIVASGDVIVGTFSIIVPLSLEGMNSFYSKAVDGSGNLSDPSNSIGIFKDTIPPDVPAFTTTGQTVGNVPSIGLHGTVDVGTHSVRIYSAGVSGYYSTYAMMGSFSISMSLIEGANTFTAYAVDIAGNISSGSIPLTIIKNSFPPLTAPTFSTPNQTTSGATIYLGGLATGASYVNIYNNGSPVISGFMMGGNVFVQRSTPLNTGTNVFTARAVDGFGNLSSPSNPITIIRSTETLTAPTFSTPSQTTSGSTILLTGIATTGISVNIYSGTTIVASGDVMTNTFSIIVPLSLEGMNSFYAKAVDAFGNLSNSSNSIGIFKDTTPPDAPVFTTTGQTVTGDGIYLAGIATGTSRVNIYNVSGILVTGSIIFAAPPQLRVLFTSLETGTNIFTAKAVDVVGNISSESSPITIVRATTPVGGFSCENVTDLDTGECYALVSLYNSTDGAHWTTGTNWLTGTIVSNWFGINVSSMHHVTTISLPNNNLSGIVMLSGLVSLKTIDVSQNHISSAYLDTDSLTSLKYLYLNNNNLTSLQPSIGYFSGLEDFFVGGNQLTTLPSSISGLVSLKNLDLGGILVSVNEDINLAGGNLISSLPNELRTLSNLKTLDISHNQITSLSPNIGNLHMLKNLIANNNKITSIPSEIGSLSGLEALSLGGNRITSLPSSISGLTDVKILDLGSDLINLLFAMPLTSGGNKITSLPDELRSLSGIMFLGLSNNQLYSLSTGIKNLENLQYLYLKNNLLMSLPESLTGLSMLTTSGGVTAEKNCRNTGVMSFSLLNFVNLKVGNSDWQTSINPACGAPTATVNYSVTGRTNQDITAFVKGFSKVVTGLNATGYLFTGNGTFTFTFSDFIGQTGSVTAIVTRIDKTLPTFSGVISGTTYTTGVAITFSDDNIGYSAMLSGQTYTNGALITNNGTYVFEVIDVAGNKTGAIFTVDIESTLPICGNSIIEGPEICDDGINNGHIGYCSSQCDGILYSQGGTPKPTKDKCPKGDSSPSYYDHTCGNNTGGVHNSPYTGTHTITDITTLIPVKDMHCNQYTNELNGAYTFAFQKGITTISDCNKVDLTGKLLRSHMAKMISNFAIITLGLKPNTGTVCNFTDMNYKSDEMKFYAKVACQLGLMGIDAHGDIKTTFDPNGVITRAEFGTILSRLLRGTKNNGGNVYYAKHLQALKSAGIMTKINTPYSEELRGWVMVMLQRIITQSSNVIHMSDPNRPIWESVVQYFVE